MFMRKKRLFIVSNRLPICISGERDKTVIEPESSDFADAVNQYFDTYSNHYSSVFWVGIPGCSPSRWNEATNHLDQSRFRYIPVLVYREQYDKYYNGFSNSVLWPLFYYSDFTAAYNEYDFENYVQVNEHFSEILTKHCRKGDTIWIHDYHLLLLPALLRNHLPSMTIGIFLQCPFPPYNQYLKLPEKVQRRLLHGITGASFVGLRRNVDAANLLESVTKILDIGCKENVIALKERVVRIETLPVNAQFDFFEKASRFSFGEAAIH
jgi:trehalose 6-phosphate synthase/phosphatase